MEFFLILSEIVCCVYNFLWSQRCLSHRSSTVFLFLHKKMLGQIKKIDLSKWPTYIIFFSTFENTRHRSFLIHLRIILTKLWSNPHMYGILIYLQRKLVNYNLLILFETENLHFKNFLYWVLPFCYGKHTKYPRMYPTGKMKKKNKNWNAAQAHLFIYFFFFFSFFKKKSVWESKGFFVLALCAFIEYPKTCFFFEK